MSDILDKFSLKGKVAIVTGGAGLLGKEFCRTLAEAGAGVVVADLNAEAALPRRRSCARPAYRAVHAAVDVTQPELGAGDGRACVDDFGRLDVLVNSAAMDPKFDAAQAGQHRNTFEDYPLEVWKQALDVNLTGLFLCCQAAARQCWRRAIRLDHQHLLHLRPGGARPAHLRETRASPSSSSRSFTPSPRPVCWG